MIPYYKSRIGDKHKMKKTNSIWAQITKIENILGDKRVYDFIKELNQCLIERN